MNAFAFKDFIEAQHTKAKIILLPNDDGSIELTKQERAGGRYYPMVLRLQEDTTQPSRIRLVIPIEDGTVKLLRKREVMQWIEDCQRWLEEFHLKEFPLTGRPSLLAGLNALYDGGQTFGEITNFLNAWIGELLVEQVEIEKIIETAPVVNDEVWLGLKRMGFEVNAKMHAYNILLWMKLEPDEIADVIAYGMENIRTRGRPLFGPDTPIERQRVINRIREWKNEAV